MKPLRHPAFTFAIAGALTACGGKAPPSPVSPPEAGSNGGEVRTAPLPSRNFLDVSSFPMNRLISGGVAKDGIPAHNAFWFAWATFWQDTAVYEP